MLEAITDVGNTAGTLALQLRQHGSSAPHEMVLGIAGALCGVTFGDLRISDATVSGAISILYGATDNVVRGTNLLAILNERVRVQLVRDAKGVCERAPADAKRDQVIKCSEQWLILLRRADNPLLGTRYED